MGLIAAVIGSAVVGAGASVYGSSQNSKAIADAQKQNQASTAATNLSAWQNYLLTRGINPSQVTQTGEVPVSTSTGNLNTKLPLWANVGSNFGTTKKFVKAGAAGSTPTGQMSISPNWWVAPPTTTAAAPTAQQQLEAKTGTLGNFGAKMTGSQDAGNIIRKLDFGGLF